MRLTSWRPQAKRPQFLPWEDGRGAGEQGTRVSAGKGAGSGRPPRGWQGTRGQRGGAHSAATYQDAEDGAVEASELLVTHAAQGSRGRAGRSAGQRRVGLQAWQPVAQRAL